MICVPIWDAREKARDEEKKYLLIGILTDLTSAFVDCGSGKDEGMETSAMYTNKRIIVAPFSDWCC